MQTVKILFKEIELTKEEQNSIVEFFAEHNSIEFHFYPIFNEKEHINSVTCDINIWVVSRYDESNSDAYHCVIRYYSFEELMPELETLVQEIYEVFAEEEDESVSIKQSLLNNTASKMYNIDRRGKGELDINYKANSVEESNERIERRLKGKSTVVSINPYKDLFK